MWYFLSGFVLGGVGGVALMCLLQINRAEEELDYEFELLERVCEHTTKSENDESVR